MEAISTDHNREDAARESGVSRLLIPVLGAAQLMLIIDLTVLNVALPAIADDLRLDRPTLTWLATTYTLTFGSLLLLGGRLADAFGRRHTFLIGLAIFVVASLASALASDGTRLVAARIGQGIGAALLSPAALSTITTTFAGAQRTRALAVWAALGGSGAVAGVILGGPLAGVALLAYWTLPNDARDGRLGR
jgi:MFS family permease